jgi:FkbM family methyltransferase
MWEARRPAGVWENAIARSHISLLVIGFVKSVLFVRPTQGAREYYRALALALGRSIVERRPVHPGKLLRQGVWVRCNGREFLLTADTVFGYYLHFFEPNTARALLRCSGDVYIDIGANVGQYVIPLSGRFKQVVAVEPNPRATAILRENLRRNKIGNVQVLERAIADHTGAARLYAGEYLTTWSLLPGPGPHVDVEAMSLDDLLRPFARIDLLKIDIEGAEVGALLSSTLLGRVENISLGLFPSDLPLIQGKLEHLGFEIHELPTLFGSMENLSICRNPQANEGGSRPPAPSVGLNAGR